MEPQAYSWTCSVCSVTWVLNSTGTSDVDRYTVGEIIGYPECVNPTYGCMSSQCLIDAFATFGLQAVEKYTTFDEAFAICQRTTGVINPVGMYHFMGLRGIVGSSLWVANSAQSYCGVYDELSRSQYNNLGPTKLIYLIP